MTTREQFLERIELRQGPPLSIGPHPPPETMDMTVRYKVLDGIDDEPAALVPIFVGAAIAAGATVDVVVAGALPNAVLGFVRTHDVRSAVVTADPAAEAARVALEMAGVRVWNHEPRAAASADAGVSGAVAGVAVTGSVVLAADASGGRGAAVLPRTHLCILSVESLVATAADVWKRWRNSLPSNLTLVTGPSRTGDIEQILTIGVHGPVALHIVLIEQADEL